MGEINNGGLGRSITGVWESRNNRIREGTSGTSTVGISGVCKGRNEIRDYRYKEISQYPGLEYTGFARVRISGVRRYEYPGFARVRISGVRKG